MTKRELIGMSADEKATAYLCDATNNLREYFHGEVVSSAPRQRPQGARKGNRVFGGQAGRYALASTRQPYDGMRRAMPL